jgi:hypothetical protein
VRLSGAKINAEGNIRIEKQYAADPTPTVIAADDGTRGFELTAGGHVEILSDNINMERGRIETDVGDVVLGRKGGNATGNFRFVGVDEEDGIVAGSGIGLYAQNRDMYLEKLLITAEGSVEILTNNFSLNRSALGESALGGSGIYIAADGDVLLTGSVLTHEDNFHLQTNGRVELDGLSVSVADSMRIERLNASGAAPVVVANDFTISAENHVEIFSNAIDIEHGQITTVSGHITLGNSGENATENFRFVGMELGEGLNAGGGIAIYARGKDAYLEQLDITAAEGVVMVARDFTLERGADGESSVSADAFYLQATGDVKLTGDLITATGDFLVAANQAVLLEGARIQAGHYLRVEQLNPSLSAPAVTAREGGGRGFLLAADGEVALLSDAIDLQGGKIVTVSGPVILGRRGEDATGDFRFVGVDAGDGIYSADSLGIYARGKNVLLENLRVESLTLTEIVANDFSIANPASTVSIGGFDLAATGDIHLTGDLTATNGDWHMVSNADVHIEDMRLSAAGSIWLE